MMLILLERNSILLVGKLMVLNRLIGLCIGSFWFFLRLLCS